MIRKGLTILILFLASVLLLAHAVVPHHHHNLQVCVADIHCNNKDDAHKHFCNQENHKHDHNTDDLSCILEKIIMFRSGQSDQDDKQIVSPDNEKNYFFVLLFSLTGVEVNYSSGTNSTSPQFHINSYVSFAPRTSGLRAPPTV
jgi:hypothetical protein